MILTLKKWLTINSFCELWNIYSSEKKKTLKTHSYLKHIVLLKKEKIIFRYSQLVEIFGNSLTTTLLATLFSVLIISLRKKYQKNETSEWF